MSELLRRTVVEVLVPATSANLGPGFDTMGLALGQHDQLMAVITDDPGVRVDIEGEGAGQLPTDDTHLVVRAIAAGLAENGIELPGLLVKCRNTIPQGRGLGSSAAAIIAGLLIARGLIDDGDDRLTDDAVLNIASGMEGHPDNVAAALLGGFTLAWMEDTETHAAARAIRRDVHSRIVPIVAVPSTPLATAEARSILSDTVSRDAAVFNLARAGALAHALCDQPDLLFVATEDRLHQDARAQAYPNSHQLLRDLRGQGLASTISGAGPSVLTLVAAQEVSPEPLPDAIGAAVGVIATACGDGWMVNAVTVEAQGARMQRRSLGAAST